MAGEGKRMSWRDQMLKDVSPCSNRSRKCSVSFGADDGIPIDADVGFLSWKRCFC